MPQTELFIELKSLKKRGRKTVTNMKGLLCAKYINVARILTFHGFHCVKDNQCLAKSPTPRPLDIRSRPRPDIFHRLNGMSDGHRNLSGNVAALEFIHSTYCTETL